MVSEAAQYFVDDSAQRQLIEARHNFEALVHSVQRRLLDPDTVTALPHTSRTQIERLTSEAGLWFASNGVGAGSVSATVAVLLDKLTELQTNIEAEIQSGSNATSAFMASVQLQLQNEKLADAALASVSNAQPEMADLD